MNPIFRDKALQEKFDRDGFVKVRLMTPEKAKELRDFYMSTEEEHKSIKAGFHTTSHTSKPELIKRVNQRLRDEMIKAADKYLINYNAMHSNFLVKEPGDGSETGYHQDWSFVDESKYFSFSAWVALEDIDETNGHMQFVEGSHRIMPTLRISPYFPWWYSRGTETLDKYRVEVPTKIGEGVIFYHATIHSSPPNRSNKPRVAAVLGMYPAEAELLHYYNEPGTGFDKIGQYKMTLDAYYNIGHNEPPINGEFQKYVSFDYTQIEPETFKKQMRNTLGWKRSTYYDIRKFFKKLSKS